MKQSNFHLSAFVALAGYFGAIANQGHNPAAGGFENPFVWWSLVLLAAIISTKEQGGCLFAIIYFASWASPYFLEAYPAAHAAAELPLDPSDAFDAALCQLQKLKHSMPASAWSAACFK